jgi:hypothetical protein
MKIMKIFNPKNNDCGNDGCYTKTRTYGNVNREKKRFDLKPRMVKKAA